MSRFILLNEKGIPTYVNVEAIYTITPEKEGSLVRFNSGSIEVAETPEEIIGKL